MLHDIKHKMALVMKRHLEDDATWSSYIKNLAQARKLLYQTELAAIKPPTQRTKARYMDIRELIEWPIRILEAKRSGSLNSISDERYEQYFGWIAKYVDALNTWSFMVASVEMICHEVRTYGLSNDLHEYLLMFFLEASLSDTMELFVGECLDKIMEEANKLGPDEILICSTEVLESIFGKHKQVNAGKAGITGNVLGIGAFIGDECDDAGVKKTMEDCSVQTAYDWVKENVGDTASRVRRRLLPIKGTKFDKTKEAVSSV